MQVLNVDYQSPDASKLFCQSLRETGFAVLRNHPVSENLIQTVYAEWEAFFTSDEKNTFVHEKGQQEGYFPFRTENAKGNPIADLKEFYHFYAWGRVPSSVKESTFAIYHVLNNLAVELLNWIEGELPSDVAKKLSMPLSQMINNSRKTLFRILHYPPLNKAIEQGAVRAAAHEDINLITLLPAATAPGLEVRDTLGNWHAVNCDPGQICVNTGDMLQLCTERYFKSTSHRVVNPTGDFQAVSRYSMPLFLHPADDVPLSDTHTSTSYLHERLREIGIY